MQHSRRLVQPVTERGARQGLPGADALRHARLFELLRQQALAERALARLDQRRHVAARMPIPSPAVLAASLGDQPSV